MIFRSKKLRYPIKSWSDIMQGHVVFILGNGPTLVDNKISLLDRYFTIGINRVFKIFAPTILFWQDQEIIRTYKQDLDRCPSIKVCRDLFDLSVSYTNFVLDKDPYRFHKTPWHLYGRGCSGGIAIQLAVAMGFRAIVLLGCDCQYINNKTDFYGRNKFHKPHTLVHFNRAMDWASKESPVPIFNCGASPYWPRISLEEAIRITSPEPRAKIEFLAMLK